MENIIVASGFSLKRTRALQGRFQQVQNLHVAPTRNLNPNEVKLKWKKPLNVTADGNVKLYKIYRGISPAVYSTAAFYASTTKTSWVQVNDTGGQQQWIYWVIACNDQDGDIGEPLVVTIPSI